MGYYTDYGLEIIENDNLEIDFEKEISKHADYGFCFSGEIKWYDCESDMISFSKKHPKVLFKISGEGEESDDLWEMFIRNGKTEKNKVILSYPPYSGAL